MRYFDQSPDEMAKAVSMEDTPVPYDEPKQSIAQRISRLEEAVEKLGALAEQTQTEIRLIKGIIG